MTNAQLLESIGIPLKNKTAGEIKTICPKCSDSRKNKKDPCLSVNITEGVYNCHHCNWSGKVFQRQTKEYVKPQPRLEKLGAKTLKWFEEVRKISNNTLLRFDVTEATEYMPSVEKEMTVICFNYYRQAELVNIKFRDAKKGFKLSKDAELIFYNLDCLEGAKECVIVEGEIDALSVYEAGYYTVLSVPNGASKGSQKLEYLDNCWEYFTNLQKIILWTDNDEAGYNLREELARRIGKEKCYRVQHIADAKDANEVLVKHGKERVMQMIGEAQPFPIEGVITMEEMYEDVSNYYHNGYPQGTKANIEGFDEHVSFMAGQITTVTGIPGSGKSEFVDYIMCQLAKQYGWVWAVCSFENQPSAIHVTKLIEKITGKSFAYRSKAFNRVNEEEMLNACINIHEYFHFININELDVTLTGILEKADELVRRKGVKGLLIDPWNYIEHKIPKGYTETQYISESLTKIKSFALRTGVHVFLIAHPTKIQKDKGTKKYEVPTLYSISGSAHFFNKTDNGFTVYRDFETNLVEVHIQKVRYSWLGKIGLCTFNYCTDTRQYSYANTGI